METPWAPTSGKYLGHLSVKCLSFCLYENGLKMTLRGCRVGLFLLVVVDVSNTIECLHDAVGTYTRMILPRSLVSFLYSAVRKKTKHAVVLDLLHNSILNVTRVCVLIFLSLKL